MADKYSADGADVKMATGSVTGPARIATAISPGYAQRIVELLNQADPPAEPQPYESNRGKGRGL